MPHFTSTRPNARVSADAGIQFASVKNRLLQRSVRRRSDQHRPKVAVNAEQCSSNRAQSSKTIQQQATVMRAVYSCRSCGGSYDEDDGHVRPRSSISQRRPTSAGSYHVESRNLRSSGTLLCSFNLRREVTSPDLVCVWNCTVQVYLKVLRGKNKIKNRLVTDL